MFISPAQIRAARALLDWNQDTLAEMVGVTKHTISKIERGDNQGGVQTLTKIYEFFDNAGIEFSENDGVRRKSGGIKTFKGRSGFIDFIWDVYETAKTVGGEICVSNVNESNFEYWLGDQDAVYTEKMSQLNNFTFKILVQEGDTNFSASNYAEYRWIQKEHFATVPFYVYGDKLAIILFDEDVDVYVIQNEKITNAQRAQFDLAWNNALTPVAGKSMRR